ncbi:MAG TPA: hypothetical protein VIT90_08045 [Lysobacter sp.]
MLFLIACLSACGNLGKPAEDRITDAMPPGSAVLASKDGLDAGARKLSLDVDKTEQDYQERLRLRARECAGTYAPSIFASAEDIREALTDKACFARADEALNSWLGMRRIAMLLKAPPLRAVPKTPLHVIPALNYIQRATFAERAGVVLLETTGKRQIVDIGNGEVVAEGSGRWITGSFSPNGRLLVGSSEGEGSQVTETETGDVLATFQVQPYQFHWIGDVAAIYRPVDRTGNNQAPPRPVLIDFASGKETGIPMSAYQVDLVVPVPGNPRRYTLFANNRAGHIELLQESGSWTARLLSEHALQDMSWSREAGVSPDGRSAFNVRGALNLVALPSLQQRSVTLKPMNVSSATATPDPDQLVLSGYLQNDKQGTQLYLYSLSRRTLAKVDTTQLLANRVIYIRSLNRNAVLDATKINLVDRFPTQAPVDANQYLEQRAQQVAASTAASTAMTRELLETYRSGYRPTPEQIALMQRARPNGSSATPYSGPVTELGRNASIEAVGVYEGGDIGQARGASHRTGTVQVLVRRSAKPIILSLSSYEPVRWVLTVEPGAKLAAVLSGGYYESQVIGAGNARVYQIGRTYAYKRGGAEYSQLDAEVARWTGKPIQVFQGRYTGSTFVVGM